MKKKLTGHIIIQICNLMGKIILHCDEQLKKIEVTLSLSPFIRVYFFLLMSFKFLLVLKSFNGVSRQFKECFNFKGSFKSVSRLFQGSVREISWVFFCNIFTNITFQLNGLSKVLNKLLSSLSTVILPPP